MFLYSNFLKDLFLPHSVFFFPREPRKSAREQFCKSAREHFEPARERFNTNLPVNPKSARELLKKCPWISKLPVNIFKKKCPWTYENWPWTTKFHHFWYFWAKSARERRKVPVKISKIYAREPRKVHVKTSKKVPVNATACPWIFFQKCPWTQKSTREHCPKNVVHGHLWCSRGKKKHCSPMYSMGVNIIL